MNAPIALFVYNRPEHTRRVLHYLKENELASQSALYIFCDGPKPDATATDIEKIKNVRTIVSAASGFEKVIVEFSESNKGLSGSITYGINKVFEKYDTIIVFEDDILAHPSFLKFCNQALRTYKKDESVFAISGFSFPLKVQLPPTYFLRAGAVWGWACWKRSWNHFSMNTEKLIEEIEKNGRVSEFDFNNNFHFFEMLKNHHVGKVSSWDVCWYASIFIANGLTYYPSGSLTVNIGMDGSGTHYSKTIYADSFHPDFTISAGECLAILNHRPAVIAEDRKAHQTLAKYLFTYQKGGMANLVKQVFKKYFGIRF